MHYRAIEINLWYPAAVAGMSYWKIEVILYRKKEKTKWSQKAKEKLGLGPSAESKMSNWRKEELNFICTSLTKQLWKY